MTGHESLIASLKELLKEAEEFQFHDFKNTKFPFPKRALVGHLEGLIEAVKEGKFDDDDE